MPDRLIRIARMIQRMFVPLQWDGPVVRPEDEFAAHHGFAVFVYTAFVGFLVVLYGTLLGGGAGPTVTGEALPFAAYLGAVRLAARAAQSRLKPQYEGADEEPPSRRNFAHIPSAVDAEDAAW
jgi:hypothetical protein